MQTLEKIRFTREQEREMYDRMRAGDVAAKDLLARSVLAWAIKCANRYTTLDEEERDSLAYLAVAVSLEKWDIERGRLTTIVAWYVRNVAERHAQNPGAVHVPAMLLGPNEPTEEKAAAYWRKYKPVAVAAMKPVSLSTPTRDCDGGEVGDRLSVSHDQFAEYDDNEEKQRQMEAYRRAMGRLAEQSERNAAILRHRLEDGETLEQVGARFGVSKERIRQIEAEYLPQLKVLASKELLSPPQQEIETMHETHEPTSATTDILSVLASKSPADIQREIDELDRQFEAMQQTYKGRRAMLLTLQKALESRDGTPTKAARASKTGKTPLRGRIVAVLERGPARVAEIAAQTDASTAYIYQVLSGGKEFVGEKGLWRLAKEAA